MDFSSDCQSVLLHVPRWYLAFYFAKKGGGILPGNIKFWPWSGPLIVQSVLLHVPRWYLAFHFAKKGGGIRPGALGSNFGLGGGLWLSISFATPRWFLAGSSENMDPKYVCCIIGNFDITSARYIFIKPR